MKQLTQNILGILITLGAIYSCASIGRPDGGPIDETPPRFIGSNPPAGALNNTRTRITLQFDEYIKLENPNEKVVISPPQVQMPEIKPSGRRININLLDSLKPNTTYTIDFADAIVDNNEGNPLGDFTFTFSTGEAIDTMVVSGTVLEASNLEPVKGILVGLHTNLADSAFTSRPFDRVAQTDARGRFSIRGIAPGTYRMYALQDTDRDYAFTQKSEAIAFHDSLIIPRYEERLRHDTIWKDTLTIDTIIERMYTHYLPDDVILRSFKEEAVNQYLIKAERLTPNKFTLYFGARADTLPTIEGLNFDERNAFIIEKNPRNDTINYWIRDSLVYKQDTLKMRMNYLYTDTLNNLVPRTDTLKLSVRAVRGAKDTKKENKKKKDEEEEPEPTVFLNVSPRISSSMNVYESMSLVFDEPIAYFDTTAIHLRQKVDTLWQDVPFIIEQDSLELRRFNIYNNWDPATEYEFVADSTAFHGIYGLFTNTINQTIRVKSLDEYGHIYFNVHNVSLPAFVELLDSQDKVLRREQVVDGKADFRYLNPGKYGARLVEDRNGNGVWDTGNFEAGEQPEMVYYYFQLVETKALWEIEQDWYVTDRPLDRQKPDELKKQKPDEKKNRRQNRNTNRR